MPDGDDARVGKEVIVEFTTITIRRGKREGCTE